MKRKEKTHNVLQTTHLQSSQVEKGHAILIRPRFSCELYQMDFQVSTKQIL